MQLVDVAAPNQRPPCNNNSSTGADGEVEEDAISVEQTNLLSVAAAQEELDNAMTAFKTAKDEESSLAARRRVQRAKQALKDVTEIVGELNEEHAQAAIGAFPRT